MIVRELLTKLGFEIDESKLVQYERSLQNVQQRLQGFGLKMSAAITAPLLGLSTASLRMANSFEQSNIALSVMLGSAEKGKKMMADLMAFTLKTPFQFSQVREGAQMLLAMGIRAEDVIDTFTALGNVAAGTGVPISRLAYNFGQIKSMGRAMSIDLKQFAMAGVPIYDELAKVVGKDREQIIQMASEGKITFDIVNQAFKNMNSEGGRYYRMMERQARSLGGQWSNLQDSFSFFLGTVGEIIADTLKLRAIMDKTATTLKKVEAAVRSLSPQSQKFLVFLGLALGLIGPLTLGFAGLIGTLKMFGAVLAAVTTAFRVGSVAALGFNLSALIIPAAIAAGIIAIALFIEDLWGWMHGQDSILGHLLGSWTDWKDAIKDLFDSLRGDMRYFREFMKIWVKDIADEIAKITGVPFFKEFYRWLFTAIGKVIEFKFSPASTVLGAAKAVVPGQYKKHIASIGQVASMTPYEMILAGVNALAELDRPYIAEYRPEPITQNNTFNITGENPQAIADTVVAEISKQTNELIRSKR